MKGYAECVDMSALNMPEKKRRLQRWIREWLGIEELLRAVMMLREEQDLSYLKLNGAMQANAEAVRDRSDKLTRLLEPHAPRIRAGRPPTATEWDQVQQENLKQFEETPNGKPLYK